MLGLQDSCAGGGEGLGLDKAAHRIVGVLVATVRRSGGDGSGGAGGGFHAVFSIPEVSPLAVVRQVPIQIVGRSEGCERDIEVPCSIFLGICDCCKEEVYFVWERVM